MKYLKEQLEYTLSEKVGLFKECLSNYQIIVIWISLLLLFYFCLLNSYAFSWGLIFKKHSVVTVILGTVGIMKNARWNKIILIFDPQRA